MKIKKNFSTLVLEFFCLIQIQLLNIENPKNPKIDSSYCGLQPELHQELSRKSARLVIAYSTVWFIDELYI
jgi:hypothetical protein